MTSVGNRAWALAAHRLEQRSASRLAQAQVLRWGQREDTSTAGHVAVVECLWLTGPRLESSEVTSIWAWAAEPRLPVSLVGAAVSAAAVQVGRRLPRQQQLLLKLVRRLLPPRKMRPLGRLWTRSRVN